MIIVCPWRASLPGDGGGATTVLLSAAGWALTAMLAFNAVRALVLIWVSEQRQKARLNPPSRAKPPASVMVPPPAAAAVASGGGAVGSSTVAAGRVVPTSSAVAAPGTLAPAPGTPPPGGGEAAAHKLNVSISTPAAVAAPSAAESGLPEAREAARETGPVRPEGWVAEGGSKGRSEDGKAPAQLPGYLLQSRGSQHHHVQPNVRNDNSNLGRVVICAMLEPAPEPNSGPGPGSEFGSGPSLGIGSKPGSGPATASSAGVATSGMPWATIEWHKRFWEPLLCKYADSKEERVTGLLVLYGRSVLHIMEGDNNQLFALLRELRPEDVGVHCLTDIRVPCYILDVRERLFDSWMASLVGRIQELELFIKFVGPKLSALTAQDSRAQALRNLYEYETTTPPEELVAALATDPLAPELDDFVATFDADYHRYVSLLALMVELEEEMEAEGEAVAGGGYADDDNDTGSPDGALHLADGRNPPPGPVLRGACAAGPQGSPIKMNEADFRAATADMGDTALWDVRRVALQSARRDDATPVRYFEDAVTEALRSLHRISQECLWDELQKHELGKRTLRSLAAEYLAAAT
ncbi:hypothetical protein VOLCADRAFT_102660 [Volvox carteri f. nagariensis]|uniref:BLUF domain-containing protein n=1 Tax=Volvox carteri f. nagariensis TaxID=3068 RepID=D8THB5_VOLCA|nr:uncharacterized protein VOLCADRAFT_102660 [Volvox carteri f. nagariensis]EFJ53043.1 hypothetical protein VOLCADRAFT_102660 [Volvox carteri f. nagariensis]|eukprot:XP_002946048.1 hypothetical protein VOLCADRAFT_102660 [Volvox carteri f. nagariensis]